MPRWLWWTPLGLFVLFWALLGLRYGWIAATLTETDVITHFAAQYVETHGGTAAVTDCAAYPVDDIAGIWMRISCTPASLGRSYDYYVNRLGGLEFQQRPEHASEQGPRT